MLLIGVTMGPLMYLIILMLQLMGEKTQKPAEILAQVSLVSPYYCLCSALSNMYQVYSEFNVCSMVVDSCMEKQHLPSESCWTVACQFSSKCCGKCFKILYAVITAQIVPTYFLRIAAS